MVTPCPQGTSQFMATRRQIKGSIKQGINENYGQYSFLSLVRHFVCFENDHRHGYHVMVGDVDHWFRFFQNWHTPELCKLLFSSFNLQLFRCSRCCHLCDILNSFLKTAGYEDLSVNKILWCYHPNENSLKYTSVTMYSRPDFRKRKLSFFLNIDLGGWQH